MKKTIAILFVVLLLLGVTACQKASSPDTSPEYNFETDFNMAYYDAGSTSFIETEKGYYYVKDFFLRFIDKETMKDIAVCNRPDCPHGEGVDFVSDLVKCGAYLGLSAPEELFYYKGDIYGFICQDNSETVGIESRCLVKISEDGTARKTVWDMKWEAVNKGEQLYKGFLHRGNYYFYTNLAPSSEKRCFSIYAYDLESKKTRLVYSKEGEDGSNLLAIGSFLYWFYPASGNEHGEIIGPDRIMQLEISTGEVSEFIGKMSVYPAGDHIYFEEWNDEALIRQMYRMNRDGTEFTKLDFEVEGIGFGDDKYIYGLGLVLKEDSSIHVYDLSSYKEMTQIALPEGIKDPHIKWMMPGNADILFVTDLAKNYFFYAYKSAIGTPDFQWHQVEKIN